MNYDIAITNECEYFETVNSYQSGKFNSIYIYSMVFAIKF